jgi:putative DNA primase/helicase
MASARKKLQRASSPKKKGEEGAARPKARNALRASRQRSPESERVPRKAESLAGKHESRLAQNALRQTSTREAQRTASLPLRAQPLPPRAEISARETPRQTQTSERPAEPDRPTAKPSAVAVPDEIRSRFVQIGRKYYFSDGTHAFTDRGRRLTTPSENTEVIRSLVLIAQARGWGDVTLTGTERFRKEAWFAASAAGLTVRGYKPSIFEQEKMSRTLTRLESAAGRSSRTPPRDAARAASPDRPPAPKHPTDRASESRLIVGRLVDYGHAPYKHDPHEPISYFLKLQTGRGERTLWGVDLERAFREARSSPQLGDEIGVQTRGQEPVVVKAQERDAEGKVVGERNLDAHRNRWIVEKSEFFKTLAAEAVPTRNEAAQQQNAGQAEAGSPDYSAHLRSAVLFAKERIRHPEDRQRFVVEVRNQLEQSAAKGESIPPIQRREPKPLTKQAERAARSPSRKIDLVRE